jgi:hypothetical protein
MSSSYVFFDADAGAAKKKAAAAGSGGGGGGRGGRGGGRRRGEGPRAEVTEAGLLKRLDADGRWLRYGMRERLRGAP